MAVALVIGLVQTLSMVALGLGVSMSAMGCRDATPSQPVRTYSVRGQVHVLHTARNEIEIHHEAIPTFVDYRGEPTGMMAMIMPFGVDSGVSLRGIGPGDKVSFTIAVDWARSPASRVTAIRKLPPDTPLTLP